MLKYMAVATVLAMPATAHAELSDVGRKIAVQRACQAAIWMSGAVETWDIAQSIINDLDGKVGDVVQLSQPMTSKHGFLTANDVTPYTISALTTVDGPLVVEVPPATDKINIFGTFVDAWMRPLADVGEAGTDEGKGGKYLFLPAGYEGDVPENGYFVFPMETYSVNFAFRPVQRGDGTLEDSVKHILDNLRVYPLAQAENPPETNFLDASGRVWDTLPYYDETYFQDIWNIVQNEPIRERDKSMYGVLKAIGIEKGKPFDTSPEWTSIYIEGAQCAFEYLQELFFTPGALLAPFYDDENRWQVFNIPQDQAKIAFPFEDDGIPLIDLRAQNYFFLTYLPVILGGNTFYLSALLDADGEVLNGTDTYRLNVPADTPAEDFWSVNTYSNVSKGFIRDAERVGISSPELDKLHANDDGSVDIYFGPEAPDGMETNWIPTGEDWFAIFRFYGPEASVFDKSWKLGNIEKVK